MHTINYLKENVDVGIMVIICEERTERMEVSVLQRILRTYQGSTLFNIKGIWRVNIKAMSLFNSRENLTANLID
jgi:hypothetical protein